MKRASHADISALPDAVVDKKLVVPVKGKVVFLRTINGKGPAVHKGIIFSTDDKGGVTVWDETRGQFWGFDLNQPLPVIKVSAEAG